MLFLFHFLSQFFLVFIFIGSCLVLLYFSAVLTCHVFISIWSCYFISQFCLNCLVKIIIISISKAQNLVPKDDSKHARAHIHARAHTRAHTLTRTHTHTHTHTHAHDHTHTRTHTGTRTHEQSDYTKLNLHSLKRAANRDLRWMNSSTERKTWQVYSLEKKKKFLGYTRMRPERVSERKGKVTPCSLTENRNVYLP